MMTHDDFLGSLSAPSPPPGLDLALEGLWWAGKGDWERAHGCVQRDEGNPRCDYVHAFLHRQEGDLGNARYWYHRAGQAMPGTSLDAEWAVVAQWLLSAVQTNVRPRASLT
jgi:hypothetical protein